MLVLAFLCIFSLQLASLFIAKAWEIC